MTANPRATTEPSGPTTSMVSPDSKSPSTSTTPAGNNDPVPRASAAAAPVSMVTRPRISLAYAIHSCRDDRLRSAPWKVVPTASPATARAMTSGASARAITARTPDQAAMRAADNFEAMPPLPRLEPVSPADTDINGSPGRTSATRRASGSRRGSAV